MRARLGAVAIVVALGALSGCGGSTDETNAGNAVEQYLDAVGAQAYTVACGYLTPAAKTKLGADCAKVLEERYSTLSSFVRTDFDDIIVNNATVNGDKATVRPADVRVEHKRTRTVKGKKKTSITYTTAQDVTNGAGFSLTKSGDNWLISAGI